MRTIDSTLDAALAGYTKLGFAARRLDVDEPFPEVAGRHVMVTGATGGIGRATVERLARNGAIVHAVGRNAGKLDALASEVNGDVRTWQTDLSLMAEVAGLADRFVAGGVPLHGLVNNVGVMSHERVETSEGFELTYATNLLGQYLLTTLLLPVLEASAPSRIVMVSSGGMYSQRLTATNLESTEDEYNGTAAYARTKRGQVVLAELWATEHERLHITANSMHPGWVDTDGVKTSLPTFRRITGPFLRDAAQGADTVVWLAASEEAEAETGRFWHDRIARKTHRMSRTVDDEGLRSAFLERVASDAAPWTE